MVAMTLSKDDVTLGRRAEPFLENLAVAPGRAAEMAGRCTGGATKSAHEIGQVGEAGFQSNARNGLVSLDQHARRPPQPGADQVLMGCHAEHRRKQSEEMKRAELHLSSRALQRNILVRAGVE